MPRQLAAAVLCLIAVALPGAPSAAPDGDPAFAVSIESPTVKVGQTAVIVTTISPRNGYRITESYRHRIINLSATDDGVEVAGKVVRGSVKDGRVVFRVEARPRTAGAHVIVGVLRFSINNGEQLDIKAAPFEATVMGTE
jgi:hypothetical protein